MIKRFPSFKTCAIDRIFESRASSEQSNRYLTTEMVD
ncbi:hypothetical protein L902_00600 [Agrobacterium radiobacter DSM 30147]|nr:hypothetical protein L902_00600 [Agrobacterium radiobacter DSM 30147]